MINMYAPLETVPDNEEAPIHIEPNRRYWPNPVSAEFCARIRDPKTDHTEEHWYDDEGNSLDPKSPKIRNVVRVTMADLKTAFIAGAARAVANTGNQTQTLGDTESQFADWVKGYFGEETSPSATVLKVYVPNLKNGFDHMLAALNEANSGPGTNRSVKITLLGSKENRWNLITGDHLERDRTLHLGQNIVIEDDATIVGSGGGMLKWCSGHLLHNGDRLERFTLDGAAMTIEWNDPEQATKTAG